MVVFAIGFKPLYIDVVCFEDTDLSHQILYLDSYGSLCLVGLLNQEGPSINIHVSV